MWPTLLLYEVFVTLAVTRAYEFNLFGDKIYSSFNQVNCFEVPKTTNRNYYNGVNDGKMPRNRTRKTNIGLHTQEEMRAALIKISEGQKIKAVAKLMNIPYTTLYRYNEKIKNSLAVDPINTERLTPNYSVRKIFTDSQEKNLVDYLTRCSNMFYGLSLLDTRKLAYEMAVINNISVPHRWHETKLAGLEWLHSFRKRYPTLSLRTPEGCSLSRATSFNRHNVAMFFDNLEDVMSRNESFGNGTRVYNLDETNTMTVQKSAKVLAVKGQKQVSKVTSAERGTLVTTCYIVNALGNTLPPVMIFPRVHFKNHMINGAPPGTLGLTTQSGWMNGDLFVETMKHFIKHTNSSKDSPTLLILDNHESHVCIQALNLAKNNGVTVLTVPPHSTAKMQPLDVGIFGPFKVAYNKAVDSWMMRNPGKTFSIYDVAGCVNEAHMKAMTPNNICGAFKATGIFPFNRDVFTDDDFAPSAVTDRLPENECHVPENRPEDRTRSPSPSLLAPVDDILWPRINLLAKSPCHFNKHLMQSTVEDSQKEPLSKLPQSSIEVPRLSELVFRVLEQSAQKPVKSYRQQTPKKSILKSIENTSRAVPPKTSTLKPIENSPSSSGALPPKISTLKLLHSSYIPENSAEKPNEFQSPFEFRGLPKAGLRKHGRTEKRKGKSIIATDTPNKNEIEQRADEKNKRQKRKKSAKAAKKKILDSDSEEDERISLYSEEEPMFDEQENEICQVDPKNFHPLQTVPNEGNFVLVEFKVKERKIYYIAKVIGYKNEDIEVSFLRKSVKNPNKFHVPNVPDIATVTLDDIKIILPRPGFTGSTKRTQGLYNFDIDFSKIDLR